MTDTPRERDDAAARWAVRLEEHPDRPEVAEGVAAWLAGDPMRKGALLRAQAALSLLDRGRALAGEVPARGPASRRGFLVAGLGAGAIAAGGAGLFVLSGWTEIGTRLGEVRKAPLPDGSIATINTDSAVKVKVTDRARHVRLQKGEAWFEVAHDPERPFIVEAGQVRVRAVGTAFSVRLQGKGADVLVTEGVIETWVAGQEERKIRIAAGAKAFVAFDQPAQPVAAPREIENALAWRDGQIALYGETLASAAQEFNRYNARKLVIDDPQLAGEKVVGQFSTDEPEAFARAAASTLGARIAVSDSTIRLYR